MVPFVISIGASKITQIPERVSERPVAHLGSSERRRRTTPEVGRAAGRTRRGTIWTLPGTVVTKQIGARAVGPPGRTRGRPPTCRARKRRTHPTTRHHQAKPRHTQSYHTPHRPVPAAQAAARRCSRCSDPPPHVGGPAAPARPRRSQVGRGRTGPFGAGGWHMRPNPIFLL